MIDVMRRAMAPLARRMRLLVGRCILDAASDGHRRQSVQVRLLAGESLQDVEHFQPGGFSSVPLPGADGLYIAPGGQRGALAVFALENRGKRPAGLSAGETVIYNIAEGHHLKLEKDGVARLVCKKVIFTAEENMTFAAKKITLDTPEAEFTGISTATDHLSSGVSGKGHRHNDPQGGRVDAPSAG